MTTKMLPMLMRVGTRKKYLVAGIAIYGKESEGNAKTIVRVHQRVDQIQTSYKALKGVGMFVVASLTAVGVWFDRY